MNAARALLALAFLASTVSAQTVSIDFDGAARGGSSGFPAFALARPPRRTPPPPNAPAPSVSVSFHGVSLPARAFSRTDRIPASLAAAIDATRSTLRLALYDLSLPGVADAIVRAKDRGVDVELIYDEGHGSAPAGGSQPAASSGPSAQFTQLVSAGVPTRLLHGGGSYGIMHDKFAVFDGELVETGSFNWTAPADASNFENALFRDDASLASFYTSAFDWMWAYGRPVNPSVAQDQPAPPASFSPPPSDPAPSVPFKGQVLPRAMFSPGGGTEARLVDAISRCQRTLDVAMFSFYSQNLADAVKAAQARGVVVRLVGDVSQARRSPQMAQLNGAGLALRLSAGRGGVGVLHHKFALLDGELLATGSFNYSANAENNNFENTFFTADGGDLAAYQGEFEAVWAQAHAPAAGEIGGGVALAGR